MIKLSLKKLSIVLAVGTAIMVTAQGCNVFQNTKQSPPKVTTQQATPKVTVHEVGQTKGRFDGQVIADTAKALVGIQYASGALGAESFTPAGFVKYVYGKGGIKTSDEISKLMIQGEKVDRNALKPGDLVFFQSTSSPSEAGQANYVGIYVGKNQFVFADQETDQIRVNNLSGRFNTQFTGARRHNTNGATIGKGARIESAVPSTQQGTIGNQIVQAGLKYLGVPYEYGSSRYSKTTMDCSAFTMWAYKEGANIDMGRGGAQAQFSYVQNHGNYSYDINNLKVGDLIFFMQYKGWRASDYQGIVASQEHIGHVGIYMGNNQILHTYSKEAGGVKITQFQGTSWGNRFIVGGRPY